MGWGGRWEWGLGWVIHVNSWLIHVNVWQKPLKYCKVISLQLIKINEKKRKKEIWDQIKKIKIYWGSRFFIEFYVFLKSLEYCEQITIIKIHWSYIIKSMNILTCTPISILGIPSHIYKIKWVWYRTIYMWWNVDTDLAEYDFKKLIWILFG